MDYLLYKVNGEGEGDTLVQFCHSEETKPRGKTTLREIHYTLCIYKWRFFKKKQNILFGVLNCRSWRED